MVGSERGSMEELRGQIFTVLGIYEVTILLHSYIMKYERAYCILRNKRFEDCNEMQLISSDSLTLFVYTTRCRDDFNLNKE